VMVPSRDLFPRYSSKIDSWSFTGAFGRNFERLINLQMWCFGCDIRHQESSLLTTYGFTKTRPPATIHGSTRYSRTRDSGYSIHLWGFGMIITNGRAALCVKRFERTPKILEGSFDPAHIFKPHDLPPFREPRSSKERFLARTLLQHLFEELHGYETYISTISHPAYRRECVQTSPKTGRLQGRREPCEAWALLALQQYAIVDTPAQMSEASGPDGGLSKPPPLPVFLA
jgi:hypothetical protein